MASTILSALSVLLCALALILCSSPADAQTDLALDCCLKVSHKHIPRNIILSYRNQAKGDGCPRNAVVLTTRRGGNFCAPTTSEAKWVKDLTTFLDARLKMCKETKFQARRCEALKPFSK